MRIAFALLLFGFAPAAHAQSSPAYKACLRRAGSSTVQAGLCAQSEFARQDQRLNRVYRHLLASMPPHSPERIQLRNSERAWLAHRDEVCRRTAQTIDNGCLIRNTVERAEALERRAGQS